MKKNIQKSSKGITLIALVITVIVILILAGVTISQLTGSDSAPAKANEASQKNAIGEAKDDVQLTAVNAQTKGYETAYVGTTISAGSSKEYVGKTVVQELYRKYGASKQIGKATVSVEPTGSADASVLDDITGGSITIYTTDYEVVGTVVLEGGTIDWGEIAPNVPSILITADGDTTLAPGGTVQLSAEFRKMSETTLNWTASTTSNTTVATVNSSGLVTVDSNAEDGQTATITATGNGVTSNSITITVQDIPSVAKYRNLTRNSSTGAVVVKADANKTLYDDNNKPVIIPAGFGIAADSGTKIEEGIVIEDAFSSGDNAVKKGSQFVWVPVDTTVTLSANYMSSGLPTTAEAATLDTDTGKGTGTISLSRYDFGSSSSKKLDSKGAQDEIYDSLSAQYYTEYKEGFTKNSRTYQASVARKDSSGEIEFISKTNSAKGFYIGRYEMGTESSTDSTAVCKSDRTTYTNIVRGNVTVSGNTTTTTGAVQKARDMYGYQTGKFASDLVNSYAWDTAIAFIEKCGTESNSANYAFQTRTRKDGNKRDTGYATNKDEQCKIYDMAGNVAEWTTESSSNTGYPCVFRGGYYSGDTNYTSSRDIDSISHGDSGIGYRPILYIL